jgi:peptidoglycan L-alanyl-D-glutamate endopeptidase CwlK
MSLVNEQAAFFQDVLKLGAFINTTGLVVVGRELQRPVEMQKLYIQTGRSKTMNSMHLKSCAIDLYFFKNGQLTYDMSLLKPIGDYWESLHSRNRWGGNWKSFKDMPHFERQV